MKKNKKPFIPLFKVHMAPTAAKKVAKTLNSGYIGQGPEVEKFEKELAKFLGNKNILTVNSGTSALTLALRMANLKPGDDIVSTPMTCTATNWPIVTQGGSISWADIDPQTGNVTPKTIQKALTKRTRAIMVVDWGGYPCDIDGIRKIAKGIPIIEDAAHAFGALYKGKKVGNKADYTCFSFQAIKQVTSGDGGLLALQNTKDYKRGKLLRWYGIDRDHRSQYDRIEIDIAECGYKFHMNDIDATIGRENLKHARRILEKHRANVVFYRKHFPKSVLLRDDSGYVSSYWLFTIRVPNVYSFISFMGKKGIMVSQVHRRNDTHPAVSGFLKNLPGVDEFTRTMVCVPCGWWVGKSERMRIVEAVNEYVGSGKDSRT